MKNPYCKNYRRNIKQLQDVQRPAFKSLKMTKGYRVFSREELDLKKKWIISKNKKRTDLF
jgi:hypothetical protein